MSFQAYLDAIKAKTGKSADELAAEARAKGLAKPGDVVAWLKGDHGLGHGHAMAVVAVMKSADKPRGSTEDQVGAHFSGGRSRWRPAFDSILEAAKGFGPDVGVSPAESYVSLVRGTKKFAIVQAGAERLDLGIKLKGAASDDRFEAAGSWNAMVTHRVRITQTGAPDADVLDWLRRAYERA
jgi:hypothetical protein